MKHQRSHADSLTLADAFAIGRHDAHAQAQLVRCAELSAAQLVEAAILRIEKLEPAVRALSHEAFDAARKRAASVRAPDDGLAGVPYLIKDSLSYPGMPAYAGSRSRDDTPGTERFAFIERFDRQGLVPVGKSTMPEFGLMGTTEPLRYGPTHNPWALDRTPGGSSGGAAAAVAAGMVPLAHGSDAGGSIRIPASCCGVVGLKTTRGFNVRARVQHLVDDLLCSDALIARTVRDAHWAYATAHPAGAAPVRDLPRLRIAVVMDGLDGVPPAEDVAAAVEETARLCSQLGHEVRRARLPIDGPELMSQFQVLWGYLGADTVERCRAEARGRPLEELLEPFTLQLGEWGARFDGTDLERVFALVTQAPRALADFFRTFDAVLSPVTREPAPLLGHLAPSRPFEPLMHAMFAFVNYTPLQNLAGTPAISVPLFSTPSGLPVGSMFAADRGQDALLLALAAELERAQPWEQRWPACA